jgi:hypothetical protein
VGARRALLCLGLLSLVGACASVRAPVRAPVSAAPAAPAPSVPPLPDVTFRSGEPPRRALVMTAVIAPPAATVAALDALARRLALPAPIGRDLLGALQDGVAPGATLARLDRLDAASPIALVYLTAGIGVDNGLCVAATFKDAALARQTLGELGVETSRSGGESARRFPSGVTRYLGVHGRTLLIASTPRTIAVAGPLAMELQTHPVASSARVTLYPRVVLPLDAPAVGAFFETRLVEALEESKEDGLKLSAPFAGALARAFGEVVAESRAITLTVDVNETAGLALALSIEPLAESSFARALDRRFPFAVEPAVAASSAGLISWGGFGAFLSSFGAYVQASGPKGRELRAANEALLARLQGPCTCAVDQDAPLGWRCAWPLRPGVKAADVLRRWADVTKRGGAWIDEVLGRPPSDGVARRFTATVRGGALVTTLQAPEASASPRAAARPTGLTDTLTAAAGANFVAYVDLASLLMRLASESADAGVSQGVTMIRAIPGLESLQVPFVVTGRSGATARYELQIPVQGLQNAARVVIPYMGVMGGAARPGN